MKDFVHKPVFTTIQPKRKLLDVLNAEEGNLPILHSTSDITGLVMNGFSLSVGADVVLYGYTEGMKVSTLGISLGDNPSNEALATTFAKRNAKWGWVLVDWRSQFILASVAKTGQIEVW